MRWLPILLLLSGCEFFLADTDEPWEPETQDTDTDAPTTGCPSGLAVPASIDTSVRSLTINGSNYTATPSTQTYNDVPPACVSSDGLRLQLLLDVSGEPFAWVRSYAAAEGSQNLVAGTGAEIVAFDFTPSMTWSDGDWSSGRWSVTGSGGTWTHSLSGNAAADSNLLNVELYVEVAP